MYEYCLNEFIDGILKVLGIDDNATFVRSKMSNKGEEIDAILKSAEYLSEEYVTEKLLTILGDIDRVDDVLKQKADENINRLSGDNSEDGEEDTEEAEA
jgi:hypothetical protein